MAQFVLKLPMNPGSGADGSQPNQRTYDSTSGSCPCRQLLRPPLSGKQQEEAEVASQGGGFEMF